MDASHATGIDQSRFSPVALFFFFLQSPGSQGGIRT